MTWVITWPDGHKSSCDCFAEIQRQAGFDSSYRIEIRHPLMPELPFFAELATKAPPMSSARMLHYEENLR